MNCEETTAELTRMMMMELQMTLIVIALMAERIKLQELIVGYVVSLVMLVPEHENTIFYNNFLFIVILAINIIY